MTQGPCILLVESELRLAVMLEDILQGAGYRVVRAPRPVDASEAIRCLHFDAAILDVATGDDQVSLLAESLDGCGIPFLLITARRTDGPSTPVRNGSVPHEYCRPAAMLRSLDSLLSPSAIA